MEPLNSSPRQLMHAAGDVSVRPQPCVSTLPRDALPALGDRALHRHAAAERDSQRAEVELSNPACAAAR